PQFFAGRTATADALMVLRYPDDPTVVYGAALGMPGEPDANGARRRVVGIPDRHSIQRNPFDLGILRPFDFVHLELKCWTGAVGRRVGIVALDVFPRRGNVLTRGPAAAQAWNDQEQKDNDPPHSLLPIPKSAGTNKKRACCPSQR